MSQIARLPASPLQPSLPQHASPVQTLLARLRAETRGAHDRIEAAPLLCGLMSPALSADSYVQALRVLHAFHARMWITLPGLLAGFLASGASEGGGFETRRDGLEALAEDIAWFGAREAPPMGAVRSLTDAASALGALYVLEGSALGARVIGRAVSDSLGVAPGRGGSFFCGATADDARDRWQAFAGVLAWAEPLLGQGGAARAVAGAIDVFASLEQELHRQAVAPGGFRAALPSQTFLSPAQAVGTLN